MKSLVAQLLVPGLYGAEILDTGQAVALHPEEAVHVTQAGEKRRRDFALGRWCARAALTALGHGKTVIGRSEDGAPCWPHGLLGSITHTKAYAAALVGRAGDFSAIGVDAERVGAVSPDLWPRLFTHTECQQLAAAQDQAVQATLLFSAKEASYKAWRPGAAPSFRDIEISLEEQGFVAGRGGKRLEGRYVVESDLVLTAAWLRR